MGSTYRTPAEADTHVTVRDPKEIIGAKGDFITSPEISQLLG